MDPDFEANAKLLGTFNALFTIAMNAERERLLGESTSDYKAESVIEAMRAVAGTQGDEYHRLTFERCLSKIVKWLKAHGERNENASRAAVEDPGWWEHGLPVKVKSKKEWYYGWLILGQDMRYQAIVYARWLGEWRAMPAPAQKARPVDSGPPLPPPKPSLRVKLALKKFPEVDEEQEAKDKRSTAAFARTVNILKYLRSLPGGETNVSEWREYINWVHEGYPPAPYGWEELLDGQEKEAAPF